MDISTLIDHLSQPAAFPVPVNRVQVIQTHISVVFLSDAHVYKVKKPVFFSFLDFSSLEKRRHFCEEEARLNRRLAPEVYLGVVPIVLRDGRAVFEADGEPIEWAVKMALLPNEATLLDRLRRHAIDSRLMQSLGQTLAGFHARAKRTEHIASFGGVEQVTRNLLDNFHQAEKQLDVIIHPHVFTRLRDLVTAELKDKEPLIEDRARRGIPCDTHGDLHLDHVYYFPDRTPPSDLVIVDCIEFNERFRYTDPIADMAFLAMDVCYHGRPDLARAFVDRYFQSGQDEEGRQLLKMYLTYRAMVRGKVEGMQLAEPEVPESSKEELQRKSRAHWLLALSFIEKPHQRPCLILLGGLPGTGKSTLGKIFADEHGFVLVRSDVVRRELGMGDDKYSEEATLRTYQECGLRARQLLYEGKRVILDANFRLNSQRRDAIELGIHCGVPALFVELRAQAEVIRARLSQRRDDPSDATWEVYQMLAKEWEACDSVVSLRHHAVDSTDDLGAMARGILQRMNEMTDFDAHPAG